MAAGPTGVLDLRMCGDLVATATFRAENEFWGWPGTSDGRPLLPAVQGASLEAVQASPPFACSALRP